MRFVNAAVVAMIALACSAPPLPNPAAAVERREQDNGGAQAPEARATPFASYVAVMHRRIHKLWGFGVLEDWDRQPASSPFNDATLMTNLEIVVNPDGTVDKVTIVRTSGHQPYDVAAIDVAYSAAPYPPTPPEIRSGNGKVYVHWRFHRDRRQCATTGVDYFILTGASARNDGGPFVPTRDAGPSQPVVHSKGLAAMTVAVAVANTRGWLDYDAPVARYWPEFAQNGKGAITVRQLLGRTCRS